jgi:hypothetical protein
MAYTKTSISNDALTELGRAMIVSLDEDSEPARIINQTFDGLLDREVGRHAWSFARSRSELAPLSAAPAFGWNYQFQLPADCLRVLDEINEEPYRREGNRLLSDSNVLQIRYIRRVTDLNELTPSFVTAFVFRLASKLAVPLVGSRELRDQMFKEYRLAVMEAESVDAMQNPADEQDDGSWLEARGGI